VISRWLILLTFGTALGCGLNAGVFFAFSSFVMKGLARLSPAQGMAAMNAINVAAVTPLFMSALFGTGAACLLLAVLTPLMWRKPGSGYVIAGALLYLAGAIVVTMVFNVPRNTALAALNESSTNAAAVWTDYLRSWTLWNHVRTISALVAAALLTIGYCAFRS
jgi:uncharacterized membrane protein